MSRNKVLLANMYAAYGRGDPQPLFTAMAPDVRFTAHAPRASFPFGGIHQGIDGVRRYIAAIASEYAWLRFEARCIVAEGDRAVVLSCGRVRRNSDGMQSEVDIANAIRLSEGRIVELDEFFDTAGIDAWRRGEPAQQSPSALAERLMFVPAAGADAADAATVIANKAQIRHCYEAYGRHDVRPFLDSLAADASYVSAARSDDFGFAAPASGRDAVAATLTRIAADFELMSYDVDAVIGDGDSVAGLCRVAHRHRASGRVARTAKVDLFRMREGRVMQFYEFFDTLGVLRQIRGET